MRKIIYIVATIIQLVLCIGSVVIQKWFPGTDVFYNWIQQMNNSVQIAFDVTLGIKFILGVLLAILIIALIYLVMKAGKRIDVLLLIALSVFYGFYIMTNNIVKTEVFFYYVFVIGAIVLLQLIKLFVKPISLKQK